MATPQPGWTVAGFRYTMHNGLRERLSFIYLANDPSNTQRSVQFWWAPGHCPPTEWQGTWREMSPSSIWLAFNGRGYDRLHSHHLHRIEARPLVYEGHDYHGRPIRMEHVNTYEMLADGTFCEVLTDDFVIVQELTEEPT